MPLGRRRQPRPAPDSVRGPFKPEQLQEAITRLDELAGRQPNNQQVFYQLGLAHLQAGDATAAATALQRAVELKPDDPNALYARGVALADSGATAEAEASWRRLLDLQPGHLTARYMLGRLLAVRGRFDDAESELKRALDETPAGQSVIAARTAEALGEVHLAQGRRADAIDAWRRGLLHNPDDLVLLGNVAAGLLDLGRFDESIAIAERAKQLGDHRPITEYNLGLASLGKGDAVAAVRHLRAAAAASPDDRAIRVRLSAALAAGGDPAAARAEVDAILREAPDDQDALTQSGALHLAAGDESAAVDAWQRAGAFPPAQVALAELAERHGRWQDADSIWQGLAAADAANPLPWLRRGIIALRRDDPKTAAVLGGEAFARAPRQPEALAVLGLAELRTGKGPDRLKQAGAGRRLVEDLLTPEERKQL